MKATATALVTMLACAGLLATLGAAGDADRALSPLVQAERCGPQPMKPRGCMSGTWICRCSADGQLCDWELIGCDAPGLLPPQPGEPRPATPRPDDPARPPLFGR